MTLTPEGEIRKAQLLRIYGWLRQRLVLLIVTALMALQFLTWRSVERLADAMPRNPPRCSDYDPCTVIIRGKVGVTGDVGLDLPTIRMLNSK